MYIYAGIDEAGYGPVLGPMVVGRSVFVVPGLKCDAPPPDLWRRLSKAVCKRVSDRAGRLAVNDSKKLKTKASGVRHLEAGCLAFAGLSGERPDRLDGWLDLLGETAHRKDDLLPGYAGSDDRPWDPLPTINTPGELAVAGGMLSATARRIGVGLGGLGAAVVFEDKFNTMVKATRSKASVSFTFVAGHLLHVWERYGEHRPTVVVDRQGGRTRYRELLALNFPGTQITVNQETPTCSSYVLRERGGGGDGSSQGDCSEGVYSGSAGAGSSVGTGASGSGGRSMTVSFMVDAETAHLPVALASMVSKYTRELLMARLNGYFTSRVPGLKPTAGYAKDGKRFLEELGPHLPGMGLSQDRLRRLA